MYFDPSMRISVMDDGSYMVEMTIEKEPDKEKGDKNKVSYDYPRTISKNVSCKNIKEVKGLVDKYLPVLARRETKNDEFDKAFEAAAAKKEA